MVCFTLGVKDSVLDLEFDDDNLQRLYQDPSFRVPRLGPDLTKQFRRKVGFIENASDDRDLATMQSMRLEKLAGDRAGQHSIRLNDQFRLALKLRTHDGRRIATVVEIVDYH